MLKFKPFNERYDFEKEVLTQNFPDYLLGPVVRWVVEVLRERRWDDYRRSSYGTKELYVAQPFIDDLQINFRRTFPQRWIDFVKEVFTQHDLAVNFLALMVQNCQDPRLARNLEDILRIGGSAFKVEVMEKHKGPYTSYEFNLMHRVPAVVQELSDRALSDSALLKEAWSYCYQHNPDYEKVVSRCCDFLEGYFKKRYWPQDTKPQITKFINQFRENPKILSYKGDTLVAPKSNVTDLLAEAANIRAQHTEGKGRKPKSSEAEFILHTTIYLWNLHENVKK